MDNKKVKKTDRIRTAVQIGFAAITNGYLIGFLQGKIYQGEAKTICLPGLNCYSCPGALGSCPIGALQAVSNDRRFHVPLYVLGFLTVMGVLFGRFICGWLCPFGLIQDLLYKIPLKKISRTFPGDKILRCIKYVILVIFVLILPALASNAFGQGDPWFCKYICPSGTLMAGWPLILMNKGLQGVLGFLFAWKSAILIVIIILSVVIYRPFCKYLCPLGAIYGMFNKISFYRYWLDEQKCTNCQQCSQICGMGIQPAQNPNSAECIRCGKCLSICPSGCLRRGKR